MKNISPQKVKKVALYDPYLSIMGGGERLILSILQVFDRAGYEVTIFWNEDLSREMTEKLQLEFHHLTFQKNIVTKGNTFAILRQLKSFDAFFYVTDGSYFLSSAKKNVVYCMVPDPKLYTRNIINKLKLWNYDFITISQFSQKALTQLGIPSKIIYPYLSADFFEPIPQKQKTILSVGRFFPHLHSKRQDIAISWFKDLITKNPRFASYKLILAGSLMEVDRDYFTTLQQMAGDNPQIEFHVNIPFSKLMQLYDQSEYYWHFAGYEVDESIHPEQTEHLGITPIEAMARGCLTFAYRAGGPKEIIKDGETGYLFTSQTELFEKMNEATQNRKSIISKASDYVSSNFSYSVFEKRVLDVLLNK